MNWDGSWLLKERSWNGIPILLSFVEDIVGGTERLPGEVCR